MKDYITSDPQAECRDQMKPLTLLQINCNKNHHVLQYCVEQFESGTWGHVDILCLCEPPYDRLHKAIHPIDQKYRSFYWFPHQSRRDKPYTAITLLNHSLKFAPEDLHLSCNRVSLRVLWGTLRLMVHSVYVPARGTTREEALDDIQMVMRNSQGQPSVIMGDFNLHHRRWGGDLCTAHNPPSEIKKILDPWDEQMWTLLTMVGHATRFDPAGHGSLSTIDLAFSSPETGSWEGRWMRLEMIEGTDHFPCTVTFDAPIVAKKADTLIPGLNWRLAEEMIPPLKAQRDPSFEVFYQIYEQKKKIVVSRWQGSRRRNDWKALPRKVREKVNELKRKVGNLRKQQKKDSSCQLTRGRIRSLRQEITKILTKNKKQSLKARIRQLDDIQTWKHNPIRRAKKKLTILKDGTLKCTDTKQILEMVMDFSHPPTAMRDYPPKMDEAKLWEPMINPKEVKMAMSQIKKGTAAGNDQVGTKLLKRIYATSPEFIEQAFAKVYQEENIPQQWLETRLAIILKSKELEVDITDIRMIGIPSVLARVFQNILRNRMLYWTIRNKALYETQFGVLPGSSCTVLLESLNHLISPILKHGSTKVAILSKVDIEKAFDKVQFNFLIQAMETANFPGKLINVVSAMMKDLTDIGSLDGFTATRKKTQGTIQGCPFSPLLFSLLLAGALKKLNTFTRAIENKFKEVKIKFLSYLDDLVLLVEVECGSKLKKWDAYGPMVHGLTAAVVEMYQKYLEEIGLSIAQGKLEHLAMPRMKVKKDFPSTINGIPMNVVDKLKILGITYSGHYYTFNTAHVEEQVDQGRNSVHDLYHLGRFIGANKRKMIIDMVLVSKVMYAATAWNGQVSQEALQKLDRLFRSFMLKAKTLSFTTPTLTAALASGIIPANVLLKKLVFENRTKKHGLYLNGQHMLLEKEVNPAVLFHPANIPVPAVAGFYESQADIPSGDEETLHLYTDASVNKHEAGFAILDPTSQTFLLYKADKQMGPFALELAAIEEAITHLDHFMRKEHKKCIIFTDSQAAIKAICNPASRNGRVIRIRQQLEQNDLVEKVKIAWTRAHGDIVGNQLADLLASLASKFGTWKQLNLPKNVVKVAAKQVVDEAMEDFFECQKASHFKYFYPTWSLVKQYLKEPSSAYLRFLNSQELYLRDFAMQMKRMRNMNNEWVKLINSNRCECDANSIQDSKHLVLDCLIFAREREEICKKLRVDAPTFEKYRQSELRDTNFYKIVRHIQLVAEEKLRKLRENVQARVNSKLPRIEE